MNKLPVIVFCCLSVILINQVHCIRLTQEIISSLATNPNISGDLISQNISDIDPLSSLMLNLDMNILTYISDDIFEYNSQFTEVDFSSNRISKIHAQAFRKLTQLTELYMGYNLLTELDESLFETNTKLKILHLQENGIQIFNANTFKSLTSLQALWIQNNQLTSLDIKLLSATRVLEELNFKGNYLTEFRYSDLKLTLPKLEKVWLTFNSFNCSFAKQVDAYLKEKNLLTNSDVSFKPLNTSCISDETYAEIVRSRKFEITTEGAA